MSEFLGFPISAPKMELVDGLVNRRPLSGKGNNTVGTKAFWWEIAFNFYREGNIDTSRKVAATFFAHRIRHRKGQPFTVKGISPLGTRQIANLDTVSNTAINSPTITLNKAVDIGRVIKFANHSQIYVVTEKGNGFTYFLDPELQVAVPSTTTVDTDPSMTVRYSDLVLKGFNYNNNNIFSQLIVLEEIK